MALTWIPRLLGLATAGYAASVIAQPRILLRPSGIDTADEPSAAAATLARAVGGRDLVTGLAMALAPTPAGMRTAIAARVGCDAADVALFAAVLRGRPEQTKAIAVAAGWGALCALSSLAVRGKS